MNQAPRDPTALAAALGGAAAAAPERAEPALCGDIDMRIGRDGTWYYQGSPIGRKALVRLFSTVLRREDDGAYYLVTPVEKCRVEVDDAPFTAVELRVEGVGGGRSLSFRTNVDDWVRAGPAHPIRLAHGPESVGPRPYVLVRDRLEALITRPVYYELVELGVEQVLGADHLFGVWSEGAFFPLGRLGT